MAIYYVDCTVSAGVGTNTGAGTELSPWTNVASAYASAASGDTIKLKTTAALPWKPTANIQDAKGIKFEPWIIAPATTGKVYVDGVDMTGSYVLRLEHVNSGAKFFDIKGVKVSGYAFRIIANIADFAYSDNYVHDSEGGAVIITLITGTVKTARNHYARCNTGIRADTLGVGGKYIEYDTRSENHVLYDRATGANTVVETYRMLSGGHSGPNWQVDAGASATHYDPIFIGGAKTVAQDVVLNSGTGAANISGGLLTYPVTDSGSFLKGFTNSGGGTNAVSATTNVTPKKIFGRKRRGGMICVARDDIEAYVTGGVFAGELFPWLDMLKTYGIKGSYCNTTREGDNINAISPAQWAEIAQVPSATYNGAIATHGRMGCHLRFAGNTGMTTQYTGAATTVRLVIANGRLQTFHNGSATPTINQDLNAHPLTIASLVNSVMTVAAGYTSTWATDGGSVADAIPANCLADVDIANVKTAANNLIVDLERLYQWEVVGAADDIQGKTGYRPRYHVYSAGSANTNIANRIVSGGFLGARLGIAPVAGITDVVYKFPLEEAAYNMGEMWGYHTNFLNRTSSATLRRSVLALCHWADWHGSPIILYAHEFAEFSLAQWEVVAQAIVDSGIAHGTYDDIGAWAASQLANRPSLAAQYALDDAWTPKLSNQSDYILWSAGVQGGSSGGLQYQVTPALSISLGG